MRAGRPRSRVAFARPVQIRILQKAPVFDEASAAGFLPAKARKPERSCPDKSTASGYFIPAKIGLGYDVRIL